MGVNTGLTSLTSMLAKRIISMIEVTKPKNQWKAARLLQRLDKKGEIQPLHWLQIPNAVIKKYFMTINQRGKK